MTKNFVTSFGHSVPIREGYRNTLPPMFDPGFYNQSEKPPLEVDFGILADMYQFSIFTEWLDFLGTLNQKHKKLLDVGGNTGLIATLFHATDRAEIVHCLDNCDYSRSLSVDRIRDMLQVIKTAKEEIVQGKPDSFAQYVLNTLFTLQSLHPAAIPRNFWNLASVNKLELHQYICGDYYSQNGKYDCITCFSAFDHFSPHEFLKKTHSLLCDNGLLYMWHINWYWVLNSPSVYGDFPYACQRLTRDDLARYFDEFYPGEKERALKGYDYWHHGEPGYTLNDYIEMAYNAGFITTNYHRLVPPNGILPKQMANWQLTGDHGITTLSAVLRDIHCFKKNVTILDLITQSFFIIFRKV